MIAKDLTLEMAKKNVPLKMQAQNRWVVWVRTDKGKVSLYQPSEHMLLPASPSEPYSWDAFDEAVKALLYNPSFHTYQDAGVAYINSHAEPVATITLYGALREGKKLSAWALRYFDVLNAYAEEGMHPGSVVFLWEGPLEPFSLAGVSVQQPPFIALTLRKIPGSPPRVGTAPTRYKRFVEMVREAADRYADKMAERMGEFGPVASKVFSALVRYGLRPRGTRRWLSRCPVCETPKSTLSVALEDRIYFSCTKGCLPQDIVARLGVEWDEEHFSAKPLKEEAGAVLPPLEGEGYAERVEEAYLQLFNSPENHPLLVRYGVSHEVALECLIGVEGAPPRLLVPTYSFLASEERTLHGYRILDQEGTTVEAQPSPSLPWFSPSFEEAEALFVAPDLLKALGVWSTLSRDPKRRWGVLFVPEEGTLPVGHLRRGRAGTVYLWTGSNVRLLGEWLEPLRTLPVQVFAVPVVELPFGAPRPEMARALQSLIHSAERVEG